MHVIVIAVIFKRWRPCLVQPPRFCSTCHQHIYHECEGKYTLGYGFSAALVKKEAKGHLLVPSLTHHVYMELTAVVASTPSATREPLHCHVRGKKCLIQGQMEGLWQDKELNHLPGIQGWTAFPLVTSPFHGQSCPLKWIF